MGQQQSAEKATSSRSTASQTEREKKVNRRVSIQALSHPKPTASEASASKDIATAPVIQAHIDNAGLQHYLQFASPDSQARIERVQRSTSRASPASRQQPAKHDVVEAGPVPVPQASGPMDVPISRSKQDEYEDEEQAYFQRNYTPISTHRPPRMPLPMADVPIPESPTLTPLKTGDADVPNIFDHDDVQGLSGDPELRRRSSIVSTTTQGEEEPGDELVPFPDGSVSQTVPTIIEWSQPGERVYVTGTFASWEKKFRLHPKKDGSGMYVKIGLPPGTHHLKFIVDNQMVTSENLPTAVDFNNVLVNYIEISTDDIAKSRRGSRIGPMQPPSSTEGTDTIQSHDDGDAYTEPDEPIAEEIPYADFRQIIPQALLDIDLSEDDPRYQLAARIISDGIGPPTLPLFLSRSILNGAVMVKDDSSVLPLPNHTVLNHLMTSSVRNGVLSTSVTTRYKKKYVTTISFKPVPKLQTS